MNTQPVNPSLFQMTGHLNLPGLSMRGGFMSPSIPEGGFFYPGAAPQVDALQRADLSPEVKEAVEQIQRGEFSGDVNGVLAQLATDVADLQRGVTTVNSGFPVRENLEAPARLLIPTDTPLRNLLPRVPGAGLAAAWRQLTSLGGGWGTGYDQPGGGSAIRMFYPETGAPVEHTSVYVPRSAPYKLLGTLGSVTNFAQASGANFMDQLGRERQNQLQNLMLNEELALTYADSTATAAPWGDGTNALAFNGMFTMVSTANGTPSAQVQTAVGALTTLHLDDQLTRIHQRGGRGLYMLMNAREAGGLTRLLQATGNIQRVMIAEQGNVIMGLRVTKYVHPISGQEVDIYVSRFVLPGDILFGSRTLPDGTNAAEVEVLPQVPVETAPEKPQQIQGYVVTDLARSLTQPDVSPFMISVYEVVKLLSAEHFAKSTGVLAPEYVAP